MVSDGGLLDACGRAVLSQGPTDFLPFVSLFIGLWDTVDLESVVINKVEKYAQDFPRRFQSYIPASRALLPYSGTV